MLATDTNVLVRMVARDDPRQMQQATAAVANGAWVSHLVLAEAILVLRDVYGLARAELIETIEALLTHQSLVIQDSDVVRAALEHFRQARRVEFSDCLVLEIARKAGHVPLATFDRDFAKLDGAQQLGSSKS